MPTTDVHTQVAFVSNHLAGHTAKVAEMLSERHALLHASSPDTALTLLRDHRIALVIICDDLPQARATTLLRGLLPTWSGPNVLLGDPRHDVVEQVLAIESGFDDVWPHDIDPRLACARARALIRRDQSPATRSTEIVHGAGLVLDRGRRVLAYRGAEMALTPREAAALDVLLRRRGQLVERDEFGIGSAQPCNRDVDTVICRLRRKIRTIGADAVQVTSVRGRGYTLRARG